MESGGMCQERVCPVYWFARLPVAGMPVKNDGGVLIEKLMERTVVQTGRIGQTG
jgi:hypothetical protein